MYIHGIVFTHICNSFLCQQKGPKINTIPVETSTPGTQILISKYDPNLKTKPKKTDSLEKCYEMSDFRTGDLNIQDNPGAFYSPKK